MNLTLSIDEAVIEKARETDSFDKDLDLQGVSILDVSDCLAGLRLHKPALQRGSAVIATSVPTARRTLVIVSIAAMPALVFLAATIVDQFVLGPNTRGMRWLLTLTERGIFGGLALSFIGTPVVLVKTLRWARHMSEGTSVILYVLSGVACVPWVLAFLYAFGLGNLS